MNKKIFKNELWRQKWIMFTTFSVMLLFIIQNSKKYDENYWGNSGFIFFLMFTTMLAFIIPIIIFKYLHSKEKLDLINSLPVTRKEMFLYKYFIGLIYFTIPFFTSIILILILDSFNYLIPINFSLPFFLVIIKYYLLNILVFTVATVGTVLTGMFVYSILGSLYLLLLPFFIAIPIYSIYYTYNSIIKNIYVYFESGLNRFFDFFNIFNELAYDRLYFSTQYLIQIISIIFIIILLFFFALFLYKKRATEQATSVLVFNKSKKLITYLISIPISTLIAYFMSEVVFHIIFEPLKIFIIFLIIFFIVTLIIEILINKGIKSINKKKALTYFGSICIFITIINVFSANNVHLFIPYTSNGYIEINYSNYSSTNIDEFWTNDTIESGKIILTNEEQIKKFNKLLKEIVKEMPKYINEKNMKEQEIWYSINVSSFGNLTNISEKHYEEVKQFVSFGITEEEAMVEVLNNYENLNYRIFEVFDGKFNEHVSGISNDYLFKNIYDYKREVGIVNEVAYTNIWEFDFDDELIKNALLTDLENYKKEFNNFNPISISYVSISDYEHINLYKNISSELKETVNLLKNYLYSLGNDGLNRQYDVYKVDVKSFVEMGEIQSKYYVTDGNLNDKDEQQIYENYLNNRRDESFEDYLLENYFEIKLVETFETKDLLDGKNDIYEYGDNRNYYIPFTKHLEELNEDVLSDMYIVKNSSKLYNDSTYAIVMYYEDILKHQDELN